MSVYKVQVLLESVYKQRIILDSVLPFSVLDDKKYNVPPLMTYN